MSTDDQSHLAIVPDEITNLQAQLHRAEANLHHAKAVVAAMETSKFWKLRSLWFGIKSVFGLAPTEQLGSKALETPIYLEPEAIELPEIESIEEPSIAEAVVEEATLEEAVAEEATLEEAEPAEPPIPIQRFEDLITQLPDCVKELGDTYLLGMTSPQEQQYVQDYAATKYLGKGDIVELGCFLGSLTISMAKGLTENPEIAQKEARIHPYDIFVCDEYVANCFLADTDYQVGDSFLDEYLSRIEDYKDSIQVHHSDLTQVGWSGGAIEFLLVDAMKTWELGNKILRNFFPFLIPGHSLVMHQDFSHFYTYWIHLIMYRLRDYFEPLYHVPGSSVIYRYRSEIPEALLQTEYCLESFSAEEIDAAFRYSLSLVSDEMQHNVVAAYSVALVLSGQREKAQSMFDRAVEYGLYSETSELVYAKEYIDADDKTLQALTTSDD